MITDTEIKKTHNYKFIEIHSSFRLESELAVD